MRLRGNSEENLDQVRVGYKTLTKQDILTALEKLSDILEKKGIRGELCICGGAALLLAFDARPSTKDVDSVFAPTAEIRSAALEIAEEMGLPTDWINDGVKGYLNSEISFTEAGMPKYRNLTIKRPSTDYLFYMKCMASRIGEESSDVEDIKFLGKALGISSSEEALKIVLQYSKGQAIAPKVQYLLQGLFD